MLIVCPSCATSYQVEHSSLGAGGRSVRCARCRNVWFAIAPMVVPALASVDDLDVVDNGPKVLAFDPPQPPEPPPAAEAAPSDAAPEYQEGEAAAEEIPAETTFDEPAPDAAAAAPDTAPQPEPASIEGIDLNGLSAEMEAERAHQAAAADAVLAEVAEEVTLADSPSLVPSVEPPGPPAARTAIAADFPADAETFNARRARNRKARRRQNIKWPVPGLPTAILALVAANMILVAWRMDIVRLMPQTASFYAAVGLPVNLRGMAFENIKMSKEQQDGMTVLLIEGSIVNVTNRAVDVPRLRLAVRNESKNEIYSWTAHPKRTVLGPGETLPFQSRLASPPAEARDVVVRFFSRRDVVAGLR